MRKWRNRRLSKPWAFHPDPMVRNLPYRSKSTGVRGVSLADELALQLGRRLPTKFKPIMLRVAMSVGSESEPKSIPAPGSFGPEGAGEKRKGKSGQISN